MANVRWYAGTVHPESGVKVGGRFMTADMRDKYNPDGTAKFTPKKKKAPKKAKPAKVKLTKVVHRPPPPVKKPPVTKRPDHKLPPRNKRDHVVNVFKTLKATCKPAHKFNVAFGELTYATETKRSGSSLVVSYDLCYSHPAVILGTLMMAVSQLVGQDAAQLFPDKTIVIADGVAFCGPGSPL